MVVLFQRCHVTTVAQKGQTSRASSVFHVFTTGSVNLKGSFRKMAKKKKKRQRRSHYTNQCLFVQMFEGTRLKKKNKKTPQKLTHYLAHKKAKGCKS